MMTIIRWENPITIIRWEDPPARTRGDRPDKADPAEWTAVADRLRAEPGRWAVVWEGPDAMEAGRVAARLGQRVVEPMRAYEAVVRSLPGTRAVYARYVWDTR